MPLSAKYFSTSWSVQCRSFSEARMNFRSTLAFNSQAGTALSLIRISQMSLREVFRISSCCPLGSLRYCRSSMTTGCPVVTPAKRFSSSGYAFSGLMPASGQLL